MYDLFVFLGLIILLFIDIKRVDEYADYNTSQLMKGVASVMVLFHHVALRLNGVIFIHLGYLAVGIFFCVSGYGIHYSYTTKPNYLEKIIKEKIPIIIITIIFTVIVSSFILPFFNVSLTLHDYFSFFGGNSLNNWYLSSIVIIYFLFYLSAKLSKGNNNKLLSIMFILLTIFEVFVFFFEFQPAWYISTYSFFIGIYISTKRDAICIKFKYILIYCFITVLSFLYANYFYVIPSNTLIENLNMLMLLFSSTIFSYTFFHILKRLKSKIIFKWFGNYSLEIITFQTIAFTITSNFNITNIFLYITVLCVVLFLSVYILGGILNFIKNALCFF